MPLDYYAMGTALGFQIAVNFLRAMGYSVHAASLNRYRVSRNNASKLMYFTDVVKYAEDVQNLVIDWMLSQEE